MATAPLASPSSTATASLYVGDLKPDVVEQHLFDFFSQVGNVKSVLVCRERHTKRSLGYGYVNFHLPADAERALETLNYTPILGQPCRIAWSHRDNQMRRSGIGNLFVNNLDESVDEKGLQDTFSAMGPIASVRIVRKDGRSLGHGFVQFERAEDAQRAITELNGKPFGLKTLEVQNFVPRDKRETTESAHFTNVYVKGFDKSWDEERLKAAFGRFGQITSTFVPRDPATNQGRGFGFVNFKDFEMARQAVAEMNNTEVDGHKIFVGQAMAKAIRVEKLKRQFEDRDRRNCYVKFLDFNVDEEALKKHFGSCGTITSAQVRRDETTRQSRGFGFVCFSTPEEAQRAVQTLNNSTLAGRNIMVFPFQRKEEREKSIAAQKQQAMFMGMGMFGNPMTMPPRGMPPNFAAAAMAPPMFYPYMFNQPGAAPQPAGSVPAGGAPGAAQPVAGQRQMRFPMMPPNMAQQFGWWQMQQAAAQGMYPAMQRRPAMQRGMPSQAPRAMAAGAPVPGVAAPGKPIPAAGPVTAPAPAGGRVQYQPTMRNPPKAVEPTAPQPAAVALAPAAESAFPAQDLLSRLRALSDPHDQKQQIGEYLFPLVQKDNAELAGKITGMLLEMDVSELIAIIETPADLQAKIKEAHEVLINAQQQSGAEPAAQ